MPDIDGYSDVMLDIETTGTQPDRAAIIQIGAVKFNLETGAVSSSFFNRSMEIPPWRAWSEDTRSWWMQQKRTILQEIYQRMEKPEVVLNDLVAWAHPAGTYRFWSKPSHFDFMFLSSYFADYQLPQMFHFREATDMNSWLRARYFPLEVPDDNIEFAGDAHNALMDSLHQLQVLFHHYEATKR